MYEYLGKLIRVVDGDTLDISVDVGFQLLVKMRLRVRGVNCPEMHGAQASGGKSARAWVEATIPTGAIVLIRTYKVEKFGRYLADLRFIPGRVDSRTEELRAVGLDLAGELLAHGLAQPFMVTEVEGDLVHSRM